MSLQHDRQSPGALGLEDNCIYLARDGVMRSHAKTAEFFGNVGKSPELKDGLTLALFHVNGPQDVHYPVWEMHPEGDELLIVASGSLSVEFRQEGREEGTQRTAPLPPQAAFIVPAGIWHRLILHEPSVLIAITPRRNTLHEKGSRPSRGRHDDRHACVLWWRRLGRRVDDGDRDRALRRQGSICAGPRPSSAPRPNPSSARSWQAAPIRSVSSRQAARQGGKCACLRIISRFRVKLDPQG